MNQIEIVYNYKYKSHTVHKPFSDSHSCIILTQSTKEKKLDNILQNYWLAIKTLINLHKDEQQYNTFYLRQQPESEQPEFVGRGGQAYADIFSGINWSDPSSFGYGALPCAQTLCYKVENSLMVMLA